MSSPPPSRAHRIWRATAWISGSTLALAVILALGSTVWRLLQSLELLDQPDATSAAFEAMTESALARTRLGLVIGIIAAPVYLIALVRQYRTRSS